MFVSGSATGLQSLTHRPALQSREDLGYTQAQIAVAELGRAPHTPTPKPRPFPTTFPKSRELAAQPGSPQPPASPPLAYADTEPLGEQPADSSHPGVRTCNPAVAAPRPRDKRGLIAISVPSPLPGPALFHGLFSSCVNARASGALPEHAFVPLQGLATTKRARFAPLIMDNGKKCKDLHG